MSPTQQHPTSLLHLRRTAHLLCVVLLLLGVGCSPQATLRGDQVDEGGLPIAGVVDREGKALPGVAVTVVGTESQAVTNGTGQYRLQCPSGEHTISFEKTGYTPANIHISVEGKNSLDVPTAMMWPLPDGKGLFAYVNHRYTPLERSEAKRYLVKEEGQSTPKTVHGLHAAPILILEDNRPLIVGHKAPAYDLRLVRLKQITAAVPPRPGLAMPPDKAYDQEVWVAEAQLPLRTRELDEPARLLYALDWETDLEAGAVYALHWGSLEGLPTEERFVYLFQYLSPEMIAEMEAAETAAAEATEEE